VNNDGNIRRIKALSKDNRVLDTIRHEIVEPGRNKVGFRRCISSVRGWNALVVRWMCGISAANGCMPRGIGARTNYNLGLLNQPENLV